MSNQRNKKELKEQEVMQNSDEKENLSFFQKLKTDKKYSAKIQLIGYGLLIVVLIIYLNISSMGNSVSGGNTAISNEEKINDQLNSTDIESNDLLKEIENNYQYDIHITMKKKNGELDEETTLRYYGKSYDDQLEIFKETLDSTVTYYKLEGRYYIKDDQSILFTDQSSVYDVLEGEYLELDEIKNLIAKASLDHVTDYSSGKKEYVYHLLIKDIILSYQKDDVVEIDAVMENETLTIDIDYSNLLKAIAGDVVECKVESVYSEIGKVEEFQVFSLEEESTSTE